jgi:hypothetical protein
MLKILYADHQQTGTDLSYQEVLLQMREILKSANYTQIPQLSSSRPLDIKEKFDLVPSISLEPSVPLWSESIMLVRQVFQDLRFKNGDFKLDAN